MQSLKRNSVGESLYRRRSRKKEDAMKPFVMIVMFDINYNFLDVAYQAVQGNESL